MSEIAIEEIRRLRDEVAHGTHVVSISGLTSIAAKAYVLANLRSSIAKTFVVVTGSNSDLDTFERDLRFWSDRMIDSQSEANTGFTTMSLPSFETDVYSGASPHAETQERRALTFWRLRRNQPDFFVVAARSLAARTVTPEETDRLGVMLRRDGQYSPDELIETLIKGGYVREDPIGNFGQFSLRGGIVDVWSPDSENPIRIEFFGDTVDSIREFDTETQLSIRQLEFASIAPMREFAVSPGDLKQWAKDARARFSNHRFARNLKDRTDFADEGEPFSGWEFLIPLSKPRKGTIFDYLEDFVFVIDEPAVVENALSKLYGNSQARLETITDLGEPGLEVEELFLAPDELRSKMDDASRLELRSLGRTAASTDEDFATDVANPMFLFPTAAKSSEIEILSRSTRKFLGKIRDSAENIRNEDHD